ncbi:MAG: hypothetical protein LAP39_30645 [Acidobacteriia bacterium]|nr:hypothetical protein [Terriglobia bacterium]
MPDLKRYWREIRAIESTLLEPTWLVSVDDPLLESRGMPVVEVPAAVAARLLYAKSHRLATKGEIEAQRTKEEAAKRAALHDALQKRGIAVVALPSQK